MRVPYKEIALYALVKWNGVEEEKALEMIDTLSNEELEGQVWASGSVNHAIDSIALKLGLSEEDKKAFSDACYNGPENAPIFNKVGSLINNQKDKEKFVLGILSDIHDGWVVDNSSEKTFNKKKDRKQLRQYLPLPLIGFNEVKSDLIFLRPILASCGLDTDSLRLEGAYHGQLQDFIQDNGLTSFEKLTLRVAEGKKFYPVLPEELAERLMPLSDEIVQEVYANWKEKDERSAIIFLKAMQEALQKKHK